MGFLAPIVGGLIGSSASRSATRAQTQADAAAIAEQRRQYDLSRQDMQPWLGAGTNALRQMQIELGRPVSTAPPLAGTETATGVRNNLYGDGFNSIPGLGGFRLPVKTQPTMGTIASGVPQTAAAPRSGFTASPGYEFVRSEGMRGLERSAAARGGAFSGNALRGLDQFNNGLASQEYANYYNRLAGLSGTGQTASNNLGSLGANTAGNIGQLLSNSGAARASGVVGSANAWGGALNQLGTLYGWGR